MFVISGRIIANFKLYLEHHQLLQLVLSPRILQKSGDFQTASKRKKSLPNSSQKLEEVPNPRVFTDTCSSLIKLGNNTSNPRSTSRPRFPAPRPPSLLFRVVSSGMPRMCVEAKAHGGVGYQTRSRLPTASFFSPLPDRPLRPSLSRVSFSFESVGHLGECVASSNAPRITINYLSASLSPSTSLDSPPFSLRLGLFDVLLAPSDDGPSLRSLGPSPSPVFKVRLRFSLEDAGDILIRVIIADWRFD